jgi:predicted NAD-dependent protein-ADP-ribosyltransferase YbiA (DUF1768 family)
VAQFQTGGITDTDSFWGCGSDGKGRNMLGRLLMELRERLRE